jgi:hypothetical protein
LVRGASFENNKFKRNLATSVSYALAFMVDEEYNVDLAFYGTIFSRIEPRLSTPG